ncbi:expressed unknown protein [Seminavis robusta]|uniref:Uncharacterized protein n=1 Tax=Seminavis robusta TaxID=568900 RepID=A0A9N8HRC4_9STRA|nr:expressed unknown protein [Seminavis robusta]|eukprot:Sro1304_g261050.1 n/a (302) ;mRNA; f:6028-6933
MAEEPIMEDVLSGSRAEIPMDEMDEDPVDPSMTISEEERRWALEIKRAVEDNEELTNLSDMTYAHHAIVANGNVDEALCRIERQQVFRDHYKVDHSVEQGVELLQELIRQQPGFLLNIDIELIRQEAINAVDCGCFNPNVALDTSSSAGFGVHDNWRIFCCGYYYIKFTSQPTLSVIRNGTLELGDFGGYGWSNFSTEVNSRLMEEVVAWYPMKWNGLLLYNTGSVANAIIALAKPLMGETMRNTLQLGCQVVEADGSCNPNRRLREFYMQPNAEEAERNMLERAKLLLTTRQNNEETFRL